MDGHDRALRAGDRTLDRDQIVLSIDFNDAQVYYYTINKKVKRLALLSALSDKAANGNMILVDKIAADEYKTKTVVAFLAAVGAGKKNLIVNDTLDAKFVKSAANIPGVQTAATGINTYDVVNADKLILSVDAAKKLEEVYA